MTTALIDHRNGTAFLFDQDQEPNMQPNASASATLQDRAVLARLTVTAASDSYTHRQATKELTDSKHASRRAARAVVQLWPNSERHAAVRSARAELYATHRRYSLPWLDDGARIVAVRAVSLYERKVDAALDAYRLAARDLAENYAAELDAAKQAQGDLFDRDRYPDHAATWRDEHDAARTILPLPNVSDLRLDVPAEQLRAYQEQARNALEETMRQARADLIERLRDPLAKMSSALADPDRIYRDSLMRNLAEVAAILPQLDPDQDQALADLARDAQALGNTHPQDCRKSKALRAATARRASELERKAAQLAAII